MSESKKVLFRQRQLSFHILPYSRPHNIVNIRRIDNIIDRVRSFIDVLTEILTVFRKTAETISSILGA